MMRISPINNCNRYANNTSFKATLDITKIKDDKPYWTEVAEEFKKQTSDYPDDKFILEQEETFMPDSNLIMRSYNKKEDYTSQDEFAFYNETKEKLGNDPKEAARNLAQLFKFSIEKGRWQKFYDENKADGIRDTIGGETIVISPEEIREMADKGIYKLHTSLLGDTIFKDERGISYLLEEEEV